ncbi:MAG: tetratricopeptide repeat protein [Acidobacteria bacterium]|nr:tetratricopeptide repeat protein [Acidobacteriota bacterium]
MYSKNKGNFWNTNYKCTDGNIYLFVKYIQGELLRAEECALDRHIQNCENCLINFSYVEEIVLGKQTLSTDQKTLLIKYLSDPIWQSAIEKTKQEIVNEVKVSLKDSLSNSNPISKPVDNNDNNIDKTYKNSYKNASNYNYPPLYKRPTFITTAFVTVFFSLTLANYLMIFHSQQKTNLLSNSTPSSIVIANEVSVNRNLYQELDKAIDEYLLLKNTLPLKNAKKIAKEMKESYGENYGIDLVSYYKSLPLSDLDKLLVYRKEMFDLLDQAVGSKYEERLKRSQELEKNFLSVGNKVEAYRAKTLISKAQHFLYDKNFESSTKEGLTFSQNNNYLFLEGYFLLWQAKHLSDTASFKEADDAFQQTINIGKRINLDDIISSSNVSLVTLYHLNNDDQRCLETVENLLFSPKKIKKDRLASLMQIAGLAAANLQKKDLSEKYLNKSVKLAEELQNSVILAKSYTFLSLTAAKEANLSQSNYYYLKSLEAIGKIEDRATRNISMFISLGYYGKTKSLEGDYSQAAKAYEQALEIAKTIDLKSNLELSQINQGLAVANKELKNYKEADQYFATASYYGNLAKKHKEITNCLLSFIPNPCQ